MRSASYTYNSAHCSKCSGRLFRSTFRHHLNSDGFDESRRALAMRRRSIKRSRASDIPRASGVLERLARSRKSRASTAVSSRSPSSSMCAPRVNGAQRTSNDTRNNDRPSWQLPSVPAEILPCRIVIQLASSNARCSTARLTGILHDAHNETCGEASGDR